MFEKTENVEKEAEDGRFKAIQTLKTLNKILLWRKDLLPQKRFAASAPGGGEPMPVWAAAAAAMTRIY